MLKRRVRLVVIAISAALVLGTALPAQAAFTGKNGKIAFDSPRDGDWEVYAIKVDGRGLQQLTFSGGDDYSAEYSPDGTWIAFVRDGGIWRMNADGSGAAFLTAGYAPTISPDGSRIAFQRWNGSYYGISSMWSNGAGIATVEGLSAHCSNPAWSPNGERIAFECEVGGDSDILWAPWDASSAPVNLTSGSAANDRYPDYSPAGGKLVFASDRGPGSFHIWRMNADGSSPSRLTSGGGTDRYPAYSPDGKKIAYQSKQGDTNFNIWTMNANGSGQQQVPRGMSNKSDSPSDWQPLCTIKGSDAVADTLTGTSAADLMCGLGLGDTLTGGDGNDVLVGGPGADTLNGLAYYNILIGGPGADVLNGGDDQDLINAWDGEVDTVECGGGADVAIVDLGADSVSGLCETVIAGGGG